MIDNEYNRYKFKKENNKIIENIENNCYCTFCKRKGFLKYSELTSNKNIYYFRCVNCGSTNNLFEEIKKRLVT